MQNIGPRIIKAIDKNVQQVEARRKGRTHLGASVLGRKCLRQIWYGFRWMHITQHQGRMLRLFARGHREEAKFIELLRGLGMLVQEGPETGGQFTFSDHNGHFGGSCDGIVHQIEKVFPDMPLDGPGLAEFKTAGEKAFIDMAGKLEDYRKWVTDPVGRTFPGKGVLTSKPEHYVQMQVYMHYFKLKWALYMVVCKNTDDLYIEIIHYKPEVAEAYADRARQIVEAGHPPPRISQDPSWWECKFCDFREICHRRAVPAKNCRSCIYSKPVENAGWACDKFHSAIPPDFIQQGCDNWDPIME
ncbi:MAG: hypothetical protein M0R28_20350 [Pigmentiphaga sp.]|nr:hypothetical protein [Pigmentiphaga sp.]